MRPLLPGGNATCAPRQLPQHSCVPVEPDMGLESFGSARPRTDYHADVGAAGRKSPEKSLQAALSCSTSWLAWASSCSQAACHCAVSAAVVPNCCLRVQLLLSMLEWPDTVAAHAIQSTYFNLLQGHEAVWVPRTFRICIRLTGSSGNVYAQIGPALIQCQQTAPDQGPLHHDRICTHRGCMAGNVRPWTGHISRTIAVPASVDPHHKARDKASPMTHTHTPHTPGSVITSPPPSATGHT